MATIETDIDLEALKNSGKRGRELVNFAFKELHYDGEKLLHTAIYAGAPHVNHIYAASMLGYSVATLRNWSSHSNGPIQSKRINGRAYWRMSRMRQ